jgi:prepilin peptidase CpaA
MTVVHYLLFAIFPIGMAFAAVSDLLTMTISNRLVLALLVAFAIAVPFAGLDLNAIGMHVLTGSIVLAIGFTCFALGWIGGGDAKLAAATALWFGFDHLLDYLVYASLFGGALSLLLIQFRLLPLPAVLARQRWIQRLHEKGAGVPYGVALAAAARMVYPQTGWMSAFGA